VKTPALATLFVVSSLAMIGLPMLNGFIGEFLVLSSTLTGGHRRWAALATLGVILSAAYMLTLVQRIFYGPQSDMVRTHPALDLDGREKLNLWPLAILMLVMGVAPNLFLTAIQTGLDQAAGYPALRARIEAAPGAKRMVITSSRPLPTTAGGQQ
jgi:NADH-quinone oxidoreductase subunit M